MVSLTLPVKTDLCFYASFGQTRQESHHCTKDIRSKINLSFSLLCLAVPANFTKRRKYSQPETEPETERKNDLTHTSHLRHILITHVFQYLFATNSIF